MTGTRIKQLAWYMPANNRVLSGDEPGVDTAGLLLPDGMNMSHYLNCYRNLKFGWDFCASMVRNNLIMPGLLEGDDTWLWRAYQFMQGNYDEVVAGALQLTAPSMETIASQVQAMLIHPSMTYDEVARLFRIPVETVVCYEKLFFNIVDRRADAKFVAQVVYPRTRLVEMFQDYLQNEGLGNIMLRAGFNNGPADVAYYAGLSDSPFNGLSAVESASKLESSIMANGYMMARAGFLNQAQNAIGIMHSRQVLQAAKAGGEQALNTSNFQTIGASILDQVQAAETKARDMSFGDTDNVVIDV